MGRGRYLIRRLLFLIPTVIGLTLLTFIISHVVPSDPAALAAGPRASPEMVAQLKKQYGLDQPLYEQYWTYFRQLLHGNLGTSIVTTHSVSHDLKAFFPASLELVLAAMILAVLIGVPLGILAATHQNSFIDQIARVFAVSSVSVPQFWSGIVLQLILALHFGLLPTSGRLPTLTKPPTHITGMYTVDSLLTGNFSLFWVALQHLILPAVVLAALPMAIIMRTLRGDLLETLGQDYVRTARAKGLTDHRVLYRHVLRNAFIPSLTMIGLSFGWTLGGTVLVEAVFDWPGIGLYAVNAATGLDFEPIMGVTLVVGIVFILLNLAVDLLYSFLDPRISYA